MKTTIGLLTLYILLSVVSCVEPKAPHTDAEFSTQLLFEKDGCKVYHMIYGGASHIFTTCECLK